MGVAWGVTTLWALTEHRSEDAAVRGGWMERGRE